MIKLALYFTCFVEAVPAVTKKNSYNALMVLT